MFTVAGGMQVAVEPVVGARTASLIWLLPVGIAGDPIGDAGAGESSVLRDVIMRGAGKYSSREFSDALDRLGVQRSTSTSGYHITISAACLGEALYETLGLLSSVVRAPTIDQESLDAVRELALQALGSLTDDPQSFVGLLSSKIALPSPFNLHGYGTEAGLKALTVESLRATWRRRCLPKGSILGIAGQVDPVGIKETLERVLEGWRGASVEPSVTGEPIGGSIHEHQASAQTHLALALDAPRDADPASMSHRLITRVLGGGGMSNRLFTQVREKRSLCYSVGMSYSGGRDRGLSQVYAGSTPERAAQTLECIRQELARMAQGISQQEFTRGIIGLKSGIVMNGESTHARAGSIAGELFRMGRVRTLAQVAAEVDALRLGGVNEYAAGAFAREVLDRATLAVVGPSAL